MEAAHPAEADDGDAHRRGHGGRAYSRESVRPWATCDDRVRVGVLGVGRIGRMHAELLAHQVPGATLGMVYDATRRRRAGRGARSTCPVAALGRASCSPATTSTPWPSARAPTPTSSCSSPRRRRARRSSARSRSRSTSPRSTGRSPRSTRPAPACRSASTAGSTRPTGSSTTPSPAARSAPLHLVRISSRDPAPPPIAYIAVSGGIFLDMTCHDIDMARYVTGSEVVEVYASGAVRVDPAIGEAGDLDTAVLTLRHADGCLTVIDNSRRATYGYDQRVEAFGDAGMASSQNPPAHTATLLTADGPHGPALPHFFVERYTASYVLQWEAFCQLRPRRRARRRCPAPTGGRRSPSGWRPGARCARADPSRSDRARLSTGRRRAGRRPRSTRVGAERDLHRPAHRFAGTQVEAAVVLRALDAAVDQQPAGEVRLAVRAHAVEQHVAVVGAAQHERRGADVDPGQLARRQQVDRSEIGDPGRPVVGDVPGVGVDARARRRTVGDDPPGDLPRRGRGAGGAGRRRSRGRRRATDVFGRGRWAATSRCSAGRAWYGTVGKRWCSRW